MGARDDFFQAIRDGDTGKLEAVLASDPLLTEAKDDNGVSAILHAAYHRRLDLAEWLASKAEALDVFEATAAGRADRLREIVSNHPEEANRWSVDGFTPLHYAAFFGREAAARQLIESGAEVNVVAKNPMAVRPINSAAAARQTGIVKRLLDHGANIDAAQHGGWTALHSAAHNGDQKLVGLLLERGASRSVKADNGQTPSDMAREAGHTALAERLRA